MQEPNYDTFARRKHKEIKTQGMESNIDSLPNLSLGRHHVLLFQDEKKATWPFSRLNGSVKDLGNQVHVK